MAAWRTPGSPGVPPHPDHGGPLAHRRRMKRGPILAVLGPAFLLAGCTGTWGWYVVNPATKSGAANLKFLIGGLYYTVLLSVTAILISVVLGLLIALPGLGENRVARGLNRVYVEVVRAVPILVLILWVYYGMPQLADLSINVFWAGGDRPRPLRQRLPGRDIPSGDPVHRPGPVRGRAFDLPWLHRHDALRDPPPGDPAHPPRPREPVRVHAEDVVARFGDRHAGADPQGERAGGDRVSARSRSIRSSSSSTWC